MIEIKAERLAKLTVGDIAEYESWRRDKRKAELIAITKELYGDNIPADSLQQIQTELKRIPSILDDNGFDITAAQFLFWKSLQKKDKDITYEQVGQYLETDKLEEYSAMLFPPDLVKKKTTRKVKRKSLKTARPVAR